MRNAKLWSVLLAAVLLCACVAGVLFVGANASQPETVWYVDGLGEEKDHYKTLDAAVKAANAKSWLSTDTGNEEHWSAGDSLRIVLEVNDTTATAGRELFGTSGTTATAWRDLGDMLPIVIDGGAETKYGFDLTGAGNNGVACTNSYTFTNLTLPWGDNAIVFRAGCGQVVFDNVEITGGTSIKFAADCQSKAVFRGWSNAHWDAVVENTDDIYTISLELKNFDYTGDNLVTARSWYNGFTFNDTVADGYNLTNGRGIENTKSKLILGTGTTFGTVATVDPRTAEEVKNIADGVDSNEYIIEIHTGAKITTLYGSTTSTVYGNITNNISGGTITTFYGGGQKPTLHGDVTNNYTGGSISTYRGGSYEGTINGNVTNNFGTADGTRTPTIAGFVGGNHNSGAINGTITNNYYSVNIRGVMYGGNRKGNVENIVNNFYDGFDLNRNDQNAHYCGSNSTGTVYNSIENNFYGGTFTNTNSSSQDFYCGNASSATFGTPNEAITYRIKNTFKGGTFTGFRVIAGSNSANLATDEYGIWNVFEDDADGSYLVSKVACYASKSQTVNKVVNTFKGTINSVICGGSNTGTVNYITNEFMEGADFKSVFYAGNNSGGTVGEIVNKLEGGKINTFYGAGSLGTVKKAKTTVGAEGSNSGPEIKNFYGGAANSSATVETIINTIYSGTFTENVYGGSNAGTITGTISNTIEGGEFNGSYFIGGNNTATFTNTDAATRVITNNIEGGTFYRIVGGSYNADVAGSIENNISTDITVQKNSSGGGGAIYGGNANGGKITGTIYNTYTGTNVGANGDNIATVITVYGGNNNSTGTIGAIVNKVESGLLCAFYGGSNYGGDAGSVTNTITGGNFVDKSIEEGAVTKVYLAGGSRVANLTGDVKTTISGGSFVNIYAGTLEGDDLNNTVVLTIAPETTVTILGDVFGCTTFTGSVNIGFNTYMVIKANAANSITVNQTEEWLSQRYIVVEGAENVGIGYGDSNVVGVVSTGGNTYLQASGNASLNSASLILTDRIAVKALFPASEVGEGFTYSFTTLKGDVLAEGVKADMKTEVIGGTEYYTVTLAALGLSEFDKEIVFTGTGLNRDEMTIIGLAESGAAYYSAEATKNETYVKLFQSIANLGLKANGKDVLYNDISYTDLEAYNPKESTVKGDTTKLTFNGMSLVMSNAVGVRLYADVTDANAAKTENLVVLVDGTPVTDRCVFNVENGVLSIDMYVNVAAMETEFKIEVTDTSDPAESYLAMWVRVDAIADKIIETDASNELAGCLLTYIQAANDYKHPAA